MCYFVNTGLWNIKTKNPRRSMIHKDSFHFAKRMLVGVTGFEPAASWSRIKDRAFCEIVYLIIYCSIVLWRVFFLVVVYCFVRGLLVMELNFC